MSSDKPRLTLSMVVRNEQGRYLRHALERHRHYISDAVIIDDGSTDGTPGLCLEMLQGIEVKLIRNQASRFSNEIELRRQQWEETVAVKPDWILNLDADEWFEDAFDGQVESLISRDGVYLYSFRLYDFWTMSAYRDDAYWQAHHYYRPFLLRYEPGYQYTWRETSQHCGRFPDNIYGLHNEISGLRLKHLGWARAEDRVSKHRRYMELDPGGINGSLAQYHSILDPEPRLLEWED
ncbi:glycosyltransferase [Paenibacillus sp. FSL R7-0273]|uniref:glycosyltransferase n=1 Tax=Paenibacillus sp. FSL R7-0273 TaxID=1536772 RepID=UPI000AC1F8E8|nr:glycosyltransferase [Paenibacillus sp. FSL R7-0273]